MLVSWGMSPATADELDHFIALAVLILLALLADMVCRHIVLKGVAKLVKKTKATWDDVVFDHKVMIRLSHIVAPLVIYLFIPVAFADTGDETIELIQRVCYVLIVLSCLFFGHAFLNAVYSVYNEKVRFRNKPLKSILQTIQVAMWFIGGIVILGKLIGQDPLTLLAGLGAVATVLMLVFKDSIVGFVSGVQLSANDMLKVGDWIKMPKYDADGIVIEVSLATVKVRNWDNTVTTVPPYALVSESFQNWNAMRESGGRRVRRAIYIDMDSIRLCTPSMMERFRKIGLLHGFMEKVDRAGGNNGYDDKDLLDGHSLTNLGVFRAYVEAYLKSLPVVNQELHCMVRHLQPTEHGLPLELYFFSKVKDWIPYEGVQADVLDYVLAALPEFGLRVFQSPTGADVRDALSSHT